MKRYLLDTNAISELVKRHPDQTVADRLRSLDASAVKTSAVCVMELRFGAARHPRGADLWRRLTSRILDRIEVLAFDAEVGRRAGEVLAQLESAGTPIGVEDVQIGATALVHGLTVVTRNLRHFRRIPGLQVESWWSG